MMAWGANPNMKLRRWSRRSAGALGGVLLLAASARLAAAGFVGEIVGPGAGNFPIAVSPLREIGGGGDAATRFAEMLGRDLSLSGYFRVLDRDAYVEDPRTSSVDAGGIDFQSWAVIGAAALVKGTLETTPNGYVVEARLFDVQGRRMLTAKRYRATTAEFPRAAHRFADEVLRVFTGIRGPFDSQIVLVSGTGGFGKELHVFTFDAAAPVRLTQDRSIVVSPAWAPDGKHVLYSSYRAGGPALYELTIGEGRVRQLTTPGPLSAGGVWSPDGTRLAVTLEIEGSPEIAVLGRDGRIAHRVTRSPAIDVSPTWSPDGRELAFCSDRAGTPQIFVATLDGVARRLTYEGSYNSTPRWSPGGREIAYVGRVGGRFEIFVIDIGGGAARQLTSGAGDNEDPGWSPDGRYLVFTSTRTGAPHLFMMDRSGRSQKQLTHGSGSDTSPAWSPWRE
jgi:TolB protein